MPSRPFSDCRTMSVPARDEVRHQRRHPDPEVDVHAVAQLARRAPGHLIARQGGHARRSSCGRSAARSVFRSFAALDDPLRRRSPGCGPDRGRAAPGSTSSSTSAIVTLRRGRHHRVEVARRLPVDEVAEAVALPGLDQREVGAERRLEHVACARRTRASPCRRRRPCRSRSPCRRPGCRRRRRGSARPASPAGVSSTSSLPLEEQLLERLVLADVARDHLLDLAVGEQDPEPLVVDAAVVRDDA